MPSADFPFTRLPTVSLDFPRPPADLLTQAASVPAATLHALLAGIAKMKLAYLHLMRSPVDGLDVFAIAREGFTGALIVNDGFDLDSAVNIVSTRGADAVSFGRHFIANPDLVERWREHQPLAQFERKTLYTPGPVGYSDYPCMRAIHDS